MTNTQIEKSERIGILIYHFFNGRIRQKEWKELNAWRNLSARNERAFQDAIDLQKLRDSLSRVHEAEQILLEKMKQNPGPWASTTKAKQPLVYRMMRTAAAAVILYIYS
jgi:ferric-dicitrate binding protein FerR (iron transport regulator)